MTEYPVILFALCKTLSPFAPQKCVCKAHFRGAKADNDLTAANRNFLRSSLPAVTKIFRILSEIRSNLGVHDLGLSCGVP